MATIHSKPQTMRNIAHLSIAVLMMGLSTMFAYGLHIVLSI